MLGPDSALLIALLVLVSVALLVAALRFRWLAVKALCGALSIVIAMTGGIAVVNYYYGYYSTWSQMWADFHSGSTGNLGTIAQSATTAQLQAGQLTWVDLPGKLSGYNRTALVYLPPQYGEARYAKVKFPVVELFHGTPGSPLSWNTVLKIGQVADSLISRHLMGPMVLVMPSINGTHHNYMDCVNSPVLKDDTYLTLDVRADILARYRVSSDPFQWGMTGYSSGGFCTANLALRHPSSFGAAAVIEGYYRAADGPAASALKHSQPLENANSPLYLAERLTADSGPVPAFWIAAGTYHKTSDYQPATMFAAALDRLQQVPFNTLNAADTANAWAAAVPEALTWLWQQLASPDQRVLFPVRSHKLGAATLPVAPIPPYHPHGCVPVKTAGRAVPTCAKMTHGQAPTVKAQTAV
jgi:poly(3-hydroxybutyrate) depolymerase